MTIVTGITTVGIFLLSKPISAYQMGESYAKNMGLQCADVSCSSCYAFQCAVRMCYRVCRTGFFRGNCSTASGEEPVPDSKADPDDSSLFSGRSILCLFCDLLARTLFAPTELSISTVTAVFGAPVVIYIMIHRKKEKAE